MPVELVNKDPRYSKVHLIDPAPLGYLHLAAEVQAAHRPGPVLRRSRDKQQLFGVLKWQARQVAGLDAVERVTVYDAVVLAPPGGDVKDRPATLPAAWFDVAVLAETSSPEAAREVRAAPAWQALAAALTQKARRVHQVAARNVRRVGDVDKTRPGLFLFNYFAGDDPALAVEVCDYPASWYEAENRPGQLPPARAARGRQSDYVLINHAGWGWQPAAVHGPPAAQEVLPQLHAGQPESPPPGSDAGPLPSGLACAAWLRQSAVQSCSVMGHAVAQRTPGRRDDRGDRASPAAVRAG